MVYCPELIVSYSLLLFLFCQLLIVLLVFSSTYGRLHRGIIKTNEAKEITPGDNSLSKFFECKKAVNNDQQPVWRSFSKNENDAFLAGINFVMSKVTSPSLRQDVCSDSGCLCSEAESCCSCTNCERS